MAVKRILVALGGSRYMDVAMREACAIAMRHGGELHGLAFADTSLSDPAEPTPIGGGSAARELRESREEAIASGMQEAITRFQEIAQQQGVTANVIEAQGDPTDVLPEILKLMDLGIFGIRHAFDYGAVEHPDDFLAHVARSSRRPILAVAAPAHPITRVLVAYDGSPPAADALRSFAVMHAFEPESVNVVLASDEEDEASAAILKEATDYLEGHGYTARGRTRPGSPADVILQEARETEADLIVMGVVGRSGFMKLVVGDTAAAVLAESRVPLYLHY